MTLAVLGCAVTATGAAVIALIFAATKEKGPSFLVNLFALSTIGFSYLGLRQKAPPEIRAIAAQPVPDWLSAVGFLLLGSTIILVSLLAITVLRDSWEEGRDKNYNRTQKLSDNLFNR